MLKSFILALTAAFEEASTESMTFADRAKQAGIVSLEGMVAIFFALTLLWIAIEILHFSLHRKPKAEKTQKVEAPAPVAKSQPAASAPAPVAPAAGNDALVAAITAAIAAAMAEDGYTGGFRVVSFKRTPSAGRRNRI